MSEHTDSTGRTAPHVAVVIPCFNVAAHVEATVRSVPAWVRTIVAVDDGSADATRQVLDGIHDTRLIRISHERNQGVGAAVVTGYRAALRQGAEICVKMDGDGQMSADDLPRLVAPLLLGEADYAKGNRFWMLDALRAMPRIRLIGNGILSFLTKLASGYWSIFDPTNGYTAIREPVLRKLDFRRLHRRYFFETSMLIELNIHRAVIRDVEMPARYGSEPSSLRVGSVMIRFPLLLLRGLTRRFFWRYMIRDFNVLTLSVLTGIPALLFGVTFGGYHWWLSLTTGVPATPGTTILAALPIILGFQCILTALVLDVLYQPVSPIGEDPQARSALAAAFASRRGAGAAIPPVASATHE
jgi:dolichol-phosphate mannosyltransferase